MKGHVTLTFDRHLNGTAGFSPAAGRGAYSVLVPVEMPQPPSQETK